MKRTILYVFIALAATACASPPKPPGESVAIATPSSTTAPTPTPDPCRIADLGRESFQALVDFIDVNGIWVGNDTQYVYTYPSANMDYVHVLRVVYEPDNKLRGTATLVEIHVDASVDIHRSGENTGFFSYRIRPDGAVFLDDCNGNPSYGDTLAIKEGTSQLLSKAKSTLSYFAVVSHCNPRVVTLTFSTEVGKEPLHSQLAQAFRAVPGIDPLLTITTGRTISIMRRRGVSAGMPIARVARTVQKATGRHAVRIRPTVTSRNFGCGGVPPHWDPERQ